MKNITRLLILVILSLTLNGCWALPIIQSSTTASGLDFKKVESVPANNALIYFYREHSMAGAISSWTIIINGKEIVDLSNEEYYPHFCVPGMTKVESQIGIYSPGLEFETEDGHVYFIRVSAAADVTSVTPVITVIGDFSIALVENDIGYKEILDNKLEIEQ